MYGCSWEGEGGTDGAGVPTHLRPRLRGCEGVGSAPFAAAVARARAAAFWAADCASGAAFRPEFTPPLYGSVSCKRGFLRLEFPMRCTAGGSGEVEVAMVGLGQRLFRGRGCTPIRWAVSVHVCWLGGTFSLGGSGLSGDREVW